MTTEVETPDPDKMIPVLAYLQKASKGRAGMSANTIKAACDDLIGVLNNYFNIERDNRFRLRASNLGRPSCQLWHEKHGTPKQSLNPQDILKFAFGDMAEILLKAVLKETFKDQYEDQKTVQVDIAGRSIKGHTDVTIMGEVDDIKTASDWSFKNKFKSSDVLVASDTFGYASQLLFYHKGGAGDLGGFYVLNKSTGEMRYTRLELTEEQREELWKKIEEKVEWINSDNPEFSRDFEDEAETFYRKETGNRVLNPVCKFCPYRETCWPGLQELPKIPSKASNPAIEYYTYVADKKETEDE